MATEHAMATMEKAANDRIAAAFETLTHRFGFELPVQPFERGDNRYLQVKGLEHQADVLELIVEASAPKPLRAKAA